MRGKWKRNEDSNSIANRKRHYGKWKRNEDSDPKKNEDSNPFANSIMESGKGTRILIYSQTALWKVEKERGF